MNRLVFSPLLNQNLAQTRKLSPANDSCLLPFNFSYTHCNNRDMNTLNIQFASGERRAGGGEINIGGVGGRAQ